MSVVLDIPRTWLWTTLHPHVTTRKLDLECLPLTPDIEYPSIRFPNLNSKIYCAHGLALDCKQVYYNMGESDEYFKLRRNAEAFKPFEDLRLKYFCASVDAERICRLLTGLRHEARGKLISLAFVLMRYGQPDLLRVCDGIE